VESGHSCPLPTDILVRRLTSSVAGASNRRCAATRRPDRNVRPLRTRMSALHIPVTFETVSAARPCRMAVHLRSVLPFHPHCPNVALSRDPERCVDQRAGVRVITGACADVDFERTPAIAVACQRAVNGAQPAWRSGSHQIALQRRHRRLVAENRRPERPPEEQIEIRRTGGLYWPLLDPGNRFRVVLRIPVDQLIEGIDAGLRGLALDDELEAVSLDLAPLPCAKTAAGMQAASAAARIRVRIAVRPPDVCSCGWIPIPGEITTSSANVLEPLPGSCRGARTASGEWRSRGPRR